MKEKAYYTIGELSDICGISKRNLRFYDEKGLLKPSKRDSSNNYRYYSEEKAIDALKIKELKKKGLSISDIKLLVKKKDLKVFRNALNQSITALEKEKQLIEEQIRQSKASYSAVSQSLIYLETAQVNRDITIDYSPETYVYFTNYRCNHHAKKLFWDRFAELTQLCEEDNFQIIGPFSAIFHEHYFNQFFFDEGQLEVFYPITPTNVKHPRVRIIEKRLMMSKIVIGNYQSLLSTYVDLINYSKENNLQIIGPNLEEYLCDFSFGLHEDDWITRIAFPIIMNDDSCTLHPKKTALKHF
ncbi:MerR family transcriptional regulator [Vagococcus sp. BWB3-3]|uniref:MerR family transcriptional regulator n=1 Tax=Vagococcus allomyrinae TaxID=2794353 RepID=A0A940SU16_9ENTE|nr:MerR family transcriptional regulator [Vagococcus allomyrinae]MBP1040875.1 MerR family transcriptional regulator [Vagococcus allomyrinae]